MDAGAAAFHLVQVPDEWKTASDQAEPEKLSGRLELVKMVQNITRPVNLMDGDSVPVSAFLPHADGSFPLGASAYEKRGVAVTVPSWDGDKCLQCNNCAFSCPHACLRPFVLTPEEAAAAPEGAKLERVKSGKGKGVYKYTMASERRICFQIFHQGQYGRCFRTPADP